MSEIAAIVARSQWARLPEFLAGRERVASIYMDGLRDLRNIRILRPQGPSSWYKFIVLLPEGVRREYVKKALAEGGVGLAGEVYAIPLHRQPPFAGADGSFPVADDVCHRHICLPIYPGMTNDEASYVVTMLRDVLMNGVTDGSEPPLTCEARGSAA